MAHERARHASPGPVGSRDAMVLKWVAAQASGAPAYRELLMSWRAFVPDRLWSM